MGHNEHKGFLDSIRDRNIAFLFSFIFVFVVTLIFLSVIGAVPMAQAPTDTSTTQSDSLSLTTGQTPATQETFIEIPVRVVAPAIRLDQNITNPESSDINTLDKALMTSAVRYPGSANLNQDGNILLFGHSSYLKVVLNPAYTEFNGIQKLKTGDTVTVYSATREYDYRVSSVKLAKADNFVIDLGGQGKKLTLVTCNSFATKSDRFVVEADFVSSKAL